MKNETIGASGFIVPQLPIFTCTECKTRFQPITIKPVFVRVCVWYGLTDEPKVKPEIHHPRYGKILDGYEVYCNSCI